MAGNQILVLTTANKGDNIISEPAFDIVTGSHGALPVT